MAVVDQRAWVGPPRGNHGAEHSMQRRYAENHSLCCIVSRAWLAYKSVERRGLRGGGPRFWALPATRNGRSGDSRATEFSQRKLTNKWLVTVPSGVECEVRAVKRRYGQLAALVLKPSPWGSITQWCFPLRRQQAGTPASRVRSMGRASPTHSSTSSKLAARRRMSRRILLHHIGL